MERKIAQRLAAWKAAGPRKPLVVFGARQTGKTTSILDFGRKNYQKVIHIDFYRQPQVKAAFADSLDPHTIVSILEALLDEDIDAATTLLFFDEVQACDQALTSLKFFCTDAPQFNVIAAGSLLGVHVAREGSFPVGYIEMQTMYPMDFEEFCWATSRKRSFDLVRQSMRTMHPCPVHDEMIRAYRTYLLVGGMPEAVKHHVMGSALADIRIIQADILTAYLVDMTKYATTADSAKIIETWESIPSQLAKESGSTKFMWKYVASGAKAERYQTALDWLVAAGLVNKCVQITTGVPPLKSFEKPGSFKLYTLDTGLLASEYDARPSDLEGTDMRTATFRGGMAENYVMQQLVSCEVSAYYWGQQSTYEVDFVVRSSEGIVPIEVKSGERVKATSARRFAEKYDCPFLVHMTAKNFGETDSVRSIPLYAASLLDTL